MECNDNPIQKTPTGIITKTMYMIDYSGLIYDEWFIVWMVHNIFAC